MRLWFELFSAQIDWHSKNFESYMKPLLGAKERKDEKKFNQSKMDNLVNYAILVCTMLLDNIGTHVANQLAIPMPIHPPRRVCVE